MALTRAELKRVWERKGTKFALFACILSALFGVAEMGAPLDDFLLVMRNKLRSHDASGQIVMVGIDSKSLYEAGRWPWSRDKYASIVDELNRKGVNRIFFSLDMTGRSDAQSDSRFIRSLSESKAPVFLRGRFSIDQVTRERTEFVPPPEFLEHAKLVNGSVWFDVFGYSWDIPYMMRYESKSVPSLATVLARAPINQDGKFRVDYSIDARSIPLISAADVLHDRVSATQLTGKDVVIAPASPEIQKGGAIPGAGLLPEAYIQTLGAETLLEGRPQYLGWLPAWLVALATMLFYISPGKKSSRRAAFGASLLAILAIPIALESHLVFVDLIPGLTLLGMVVGQRVWLRFLAALHKQGITNVVSGLKNLNALRELKERPGTALIVANILNYSSVKSALPMEFEKPLIDEIVKRLTVGSPQVEIFQGDDGAFAWLIDADKVGDVSGHVEAIHSFFRSAVAVGGRTFQLNLSFGIDEDDSRSLSNRMGTALLASQEASKGGLRAQRANAETSKDVAWKLDLLGRLDEAIGNGEIWVAYQPKLDLKTNRICGAEALVRWTHPERGQLSPDEFVTLAEQQNCIGNLTAFVLSSAIELAAQINARGIDFGIAVNLSPRAVDEVEIDVLTRDLLAANKLLPGSLTMEVTETAAIGSSGAFVALLNRLCGMGIQISVDDYGSGLSTLGYLKTIPANEIKIDKEFVRNMQSVAEDHLMVKSTIELAHSLNRSVVAEGVESGDSLQALTALGCDKAQGYFIGRPMPSRQLFRAILEDNRKLAA
jgi:diguanylate cyclase